MAFKRGCTINFRKSNMNPEAKITYEEFKVALTMQKIKRNSGFI